MSDKAIAGERLQKALAAAGVASRRHAEELIVAGRVTVNAQVITELGTRVSPSDQLAVDGKPIDRRSHFAYIMLNKPEGVVSTAQDERSRRTVVDLVQSAERVYPVGRLDLDSEGLILLTNDGELAFRLLHPRHEVPREYFVWVVPNPTDEQLIQLRQGVAIADWEASPARIARRPGGALSVVIHEGHKRQIRLMCQAVGLRVVKLIRVRFGPLDLGSLAPGEWRPLRPPEIEALQRAAGPAPTTRRAGP